jgi:hypothetical protein
MAEYYAVLKKAVRGLDAGSAEARRAVYDKARNALIGQLKAIDPPLAASEISRQRLELEEAIRRVERETVAEVQGARVTRPVGAEPASSTAPEPVPPPRHSGPPSPQDIFRRAIQEAEARGAAAGHLPERAPTRPVRPYGDGNGATVAPPGNWAQAARPEHHQTETTESGTAARLAPDYDDDWQSRETESSRPPDAHSDRPGRPRPPGRRPQQEDYFEEDDSLEAERPAGRSRLPTILLFALIVGVITGIGVLAWSQRTMIADLLASFDSEPTEVAAPEAVPAPPDIQSKSEDRLADGSGGSSVRVVGESEVPAPPDASSDPIADTIAGMPSTMDSATAGGPTAVLYEEPLDAAAAAVGVTAIDAAVTWRFVEDGASGPEISADLNVPERGITIRLAIRRNDDPTLPASHLVETVINAPPDFPGKGIRSVPRLVLKSGENERGDPLIGAAAKVADGFFWIALSAAEADVERNLQLLRERSWLDLPVVYETGQRAILTFEKGAQGAEVFENAFAAWNTG